MIHPDRIRYIRDACDNGPPHMGAETEGILTDTRTFEVIHRLGTAQPTSAIKAWLCEHGAEELAKSVTPDVPETTVEANPDPVRCPTSSAASQRLCAILIDAAVRHLAPHAQLLHGAAWRPPNITEDDASEAASAFKRRYYRFQIGVHGDKVGAAAGDHLNLSAPWMGPVGTAETSRKMIEMTARMRLVGGALSIALSAASPLYFGAESAAGGVRFRTALTPWESARLGNVWPGRTIMDVSGLWKSPVKFRRTMRRFAATGTLLSGRDVWLIARAQPGPHEEGEPFENIVARLNLDDDRVTGLLDACFRYGKVDPENPFREDPAWQAIEAWRQDHLCHIIDAPRNRVEIRTLETPPAFAQNSPGGDYQTPYSWLRSVHAFLELLFIYLSENPAVTEDLEYGELELQAAKSNEQAVLSGGLDTPIRWMGAGMHTLTAREALSRLLDHMAPLAEGLGRDNDLELVRRAAAGEVLPPAARIRQEVCAEYGIDLQTRHNARMLPNDDYPRALLRRSREAMALELEQIEQDLVAVPPADHARLARLLELAHHLRA